ncbi:MAG: molybdopterin-dependent oxidoreductase [Chloroflexota bacterium]|nr:molybdopterin-dependent oxidoreductase [Chloroflexota bacterium]
MTNFRGAAAGLAAASAALGAEELLAGLLPGAPSLIVAIGTLIIDLQPPGGKELIVALFGEADKLALIVAVTVVALLIGAGLGVVATRNRTVADVGFLAFGGLALYAALQDPQATPLFTLLSTAVAVAVAIIVLRWLLSWPDARSAPSESSDAADPERRGFLRRAGATLVVATLGAVMGRYLLGVRDVPVAATTVMIPAPVEMAPPPAAATMLQVPGITPLIVPNDEFYRIDTSLIVPTIDAATWRLRVHGMVDREVGLTYAELVALPLVERYVTIACVSNEVGGDLVGNALWTGVRLREVLAMAGVRSGATQVVGRAQDGWTAGFPTEIGLDGGREALIAVQMNGEPLPRAHGFPARLIVPGLFGYVSATKWLTEIELTTLEGFDAYWVPLGWSKLGPILTQSRIDVPRRGATVPAGLVTVAGVAWAPHRGVEGVEIRVDEGPWQACELSQPLSDDTWVQWKRDWQTTPGRHTIQVRATDGLGEVQTADRTRPAPDGARGHHTIDVQVS